MGETSLRKDERIGLVVAFALHALLVVVLLLQPSSRHEIEPTQRMTVNLAEDVGMEATAPESVSESRAAIAPILSDTPVPAPEIEKSLPEPVERPVERAQPPRPAPAKATKPKPREPEPKPQPAKPKPSKQSGGSRVGDNFLEGAGDSTKTDETRVPASKIGASAKASLFQAVARQLKPHWQPPSGPEVDEIVTKVRFRLNPDGSLSGRPSIVGQSGVNDTNRAQAGRHGEQAVRAIQLAAPFDLPDQYYEAWKLITVDFDWKLAQ